MSDPVAYAFVGPDGCRWTGDEWGAIGFDLELLLAGPGVLLPRLQRRADEPHPPRDDDSVAAGVLLDPARKVLLTFAWEAAAVDPRTRAAVFELLAEAWPGWRIEWSYDGQTGLRRHAGLDPDDDRGLAVPALPCPALGPGEKRAEDDPYVTVVTVGTEGCHLLAAVSDHPAAEGPALLDRLAAAPGHGRRHGCAEAGLHVDPERRRVGWWLTGAEALAHRVPGRWPGWTVEFWEDDWTRHERVSAGRFAQPPADRAAARAAVREAVRRQRAAPRPDTLR
ncbi:hypothetical protein [Streptomyces sp. NPDC089799]|uniref:hypothetical protein n=1 Tax=Streptomyces sp. NPDC089799 TaxID=3155066 RepID=UPI003422369A